ncbi:MAG: ribonuclease J [Deferribacterales bacterium]
MTFSVSFLGGLGEIGANCTIYETSNSAIIVDAGLKFFQHDYLGLDYTIPDFSYLESIRDKLKAVVITHGHEDHIGALPLLFKKFQIPLYAGNYSTRLIKHKIAESKYRPKSFNIFEDGDILTFDDITIEAIEITHSIPDSYFFLIKNKNDRFLHCGDFRVENSPIIGKSFPWNKISSLRNQIKAVFVDTTNIYDEHISKEETTLYDELLESIKQAPGKVFITTFSTNISRIKLIIDAVNEAGKKLVIDGNAFNKNINIARDLSYLSIPENLIIPIEHIDRYEDDELCFLTTGCQGESNSSLSKIAAREKKKIKIKSGDLVIFSSKTIPGNEKNVNKIKNAIYLQDGFIKDNIHISGHAVQQDILRLIDEIKPQFTIPIHGEVFNQKTLERLLKDYDYTETVSLLNGNKIIFTSDTYTIKDIPNGVIYIDQRNMQEYDEELFREKKYIARDGVVIIHIKNNNIIIDTLGFKNTPELDIKLKRYINEQMTITKNDTIDLDIRDLLELSVRKFYKKIWDRKPIVKIYLEENIYGNI